MGVLHCHRNGCDSIMCDTYVPSMGYICNVCKEEFRNYISSILFFTEYENWIILELQEFMYSYKNNFKNDSDITQIIDEFFEKHTK